MVNKQLSLCEINKFKSIPDSDIVVLLLLLLLISLESFQHLLRTRWLSDAMLANSIPTDCRLSWTVMREFSVELLFGESLHEGPLVGSGLLGGLLPGRPLLGRPLLRRSLFGRLLLGGSLLRGQLFGELLFRGTLFGGLLFWGSLCGWSLVLWHVLIRRIAPKEKQRMESKGEKRVITDTCNVKKVHSNNSTSYREVMLCRISTLTLFLPTGFVCSFSLWWNIFLLCRSYMLINASFL